MNTLNKFLIGVFVVLLVVLGGLWYWQRATSPLETSTQSKAAAEPAKATTASTPTSPASPARATAAAREQLQAAIALRNQKKPVEARNALWKLLTDHPDTPLRPEVEKTLSEINTLIITTPIPAPEKVDYTIKPGDSLAKIAKQFNTTVELIQKSNRLNTTLIRPGDRLRIYQAKFRVEVDKGDNTLTVYDDGRFFKSYRCGTGEYGLTPEGDFKIVDRIPNPAWWKDGKVIPFGDTNNILGTHWLKLDVPGYGIHGTWEPESIGKQSSAGCVRLLNEEIAELFALLPYGTPVTIHE